MIKTNSIGTAVRQKDGPARVTGSAKYYADFIFPGMLQIRILRSPYPAADIVSIDTSAAEAVEGVEKVVTYKDIKGKNRITGLITFPTNKGDGWDRPILNDEKVFQYGDAIAIVCATSEKIAKAAAKLVKVELEQLPEYMDAPSAMAEDAMEIHPGTPNVYFEQKIVKGEETAPIMDKADVVLEGSYYVQRQPHMPIEPDVGFAFIDDDGKLNIHSKSIGLHLHAAMIAPGLGVELENLIMVQNYAGGTFGYKFSPTMEALVGAACLATGKPVFLNYTWEQQQQYTGKRSPFFTDIRLAASKDGELLGMETDWICDHGPYSEFGDLLTLRGAQFIGAGYKLENIRGLGKTVCTNHAWGSAFRGYGAPETEFGYEVMMDELAEKIGMDPFDLREKNVYRESQGTTTPTGCKPEVYCLEDIFTVGRPKYEEMKKWAAEDAAEGFKRGVGIAVGIYGSGLDGPDTAESAIELNKDGSVTLFNCWHDHGQGADIGCLGTAHETLRPLGLKPEQIHLVMNDTRNCPNGGPAGGSRSQVVIGNAIIAACRSLMDAMRKADNSYMTYDEMVAAGKELRYDGKWSAPASDCDENGQGSPFACYMYGLFMSGVEVEIATGKVQVEKMKLIADIGKINNKLAVDGQLYGGLAQGVGLALTEDFEDIKKHATMVGAGFPYIKQIPDDIELVYVETERPNGPHGASGVGELPLTTPHSSIINAIYNACGARVTHLPARPEKVLAAMKG